MSGRVSLDRPNTPIEQNSPFLELPREVLINILSFLNPQELAETSLVCRELNILCSDPFFWQIFLRGFGHEKKEEDPKQVFQELLFLDQRLTSGHYSFSLLHGHQSSIYGLAIDKMTLASYSREGTIKLWNLRNAECIQTFQHDEGMISAMKLFNKTLISCAQTIKVWNTESGKCIQEIKSELITVDLAITKDEKAIICAGLHNKIGSCELGTGKFRHTFEGHQSWVTSVILTKNDTQLISASEDQTIKIWDVEKRNCIRTFDYNHSFFASILIRTKDDKLIACSRDKVKILNLSTGEDLQTLEYQNEFFGHSFAFSKSNILVSGTVDKKLKFWDISTGACIRTIDQESEVYTLLLTHQGKLILGCGENTIKIMDFKEE